MGNFQDSHTVSMIFKLWNSLKWRLNLGSKTTEMRHHNYRFNHDFWASLSLDFEIYSNRYLIAKDQNEGSRKTEKTLGLKATFNGVLKTETAVGYTIFPLSNHLSLHRTSNIKPNSYKFILNVDDSKLMWQSESWSKYSKKSVCTCILTTKTWMMEFTIENN